MMEKLEIIRAFFAPYRGIIVITLRMICAIAILMSLWFSARTIEATAYTNIIYQSTAQPVKMLPRHPPQHYGEWIYRQASVTGWFDPQNTVVIDGITRFGLVGRRVFSMMFPTNGGSYVLVDRGWIERGAVFQPIERLESITATGFLLPPGQLERSINTHQTEQLRRVDISAIAERLHVEQYWPLVLVLGPDSSAVAEGAISDEPSVLTLSNNDLAYTIFWLSIALAIIVGLFLERRLHINHLRDEFVKENPIP
ncbi:MAG: SURF1 family protein [Pseudomonadota bacterium]